jgi:muconolactone D-isomerase
MIFHVEMEVNIPSNLDKEFVDGLKLKEREISQAYQKSGKWAYIWRVAGQYSNISIFDVESPAELHEIMLSLPLFPYMKVEVKALCVHPSAVKRTEL